MVLTLKVISCAINYNDGLIKEEEDLREAQKKYRLIKCPSIIEYFGYCLCCGAHFAGPVYEMKDYLDWTEGKGVFARLLLLFIFLCSCLLASFVTEIESKIAA
jgi:lysophospholipid acyltransferase